MFCGKIFLLCSLTVLDLIIGSSAQGRFNSWGREETKCPSINPVGVGNCTRGWISDGETSRNCALPNYRNLSPCTVRHPMGLFSGGASATNSVYCIRKKLSCLDKIEFPSDLVQLFLNQNSLSDDVQLKQTLNYLPRLMRIDASSNDFVQLPEEMFASNPSLEVVTFDRNFIAYIPESTFVGNFNLTAVYFRGNKIQFLPWYLFASNLRLRTVDFRGNQLTQIPVDLFYDNSFLETINFSGNRINGIEEGSFSSNPVLREVDFSSNNLTDVSANLFGFSTHLRSLKLSRNGIENIPEEFLSHCLELDSLSLSSNRIATLPTGWLRNNVLLTYLDLTGNPISQLPASMLIGRPFLRVIGVGNDDDSDNERYRASLLWRSLRRPRLHNRTVFRRWY